jgi:hypothetical protein
MAVGSPAPAMGLMCQYEFDTNCSGLARPSSRGPQPTAEERDLVFFLAYLP